MEKLKFETNQEMIKVIKYQHTNFNVQQTGVPEKEQREQRKVKFFKKWKKYRKIQNHNEILMNIITI